MTTPQAAPAEPKKKNYLLWGCLIILVLMCLVVGCLVTVVGLSFSGVDPLGLKLDQYIEDFSPWLDYEEPYYDPTYEDKDIAPDDEVEEPSIDSVPDSGFDQLAPFYSDNFTFSFFYPEDWEMMEDEYNEGVSFYDLSSNNHFTVGKGWLCQGCTTAADIAIKFMETIEFQAQPGSFVALENFPYDVPTGEDAYYSVMEWDNMEGDYMWVYAIHIYNEDPVEDMDISFIMWGDDPDTIEMQRELLDKVVASYGN